VYIYTLGRDRYAVTVTWHVTVTHKSGGPVSSSEDPLILYDNEDLVFETPTLHSCGRTAIRSVAAMTYDQANNLIHGRAPDLHPSKVPPGQAGQDVGKHLFDGLRKDLKWLTVFGRFLKSQRERNGALDLTQKSGELKFRLSDEGEPVDVDEKEAMEIHGTIAELMIIANSTVARIIDHYRPGETLVRIHPPPPPSKLKLLQDVALQAGLEVSHSTSPGEVLDQLMAFRQEILYPTSNSNAKIDSTLEAHSISEFVLSAIIRAMSQAKYVCARDCIISDDLLTGNNKETGDRTATDGRILGHYGLGLSHYTHFTSPIRRYADIVVHRQLLSVLESLGGGCGLKVMKLMSNDESDANVCTDYSDIRKITKKTKIVDKNDSFTMSSVDSVASGNSNQGKIDICMYEFTYISIYQFDHVDKYQFTNIIFI
jgi:exoribonuclease R